MVNFEKVVRLFLLLFTLSPLPVNPQASDPPPQVKMSLTPNPVGVGDSISLVLEIPAESVEEVDISSIVFPEGLQVRRGPFLRPDYEIDVRGRQRSSVRITYTLRGQTAGRITMEPLSLSVAGQTWKTEEFLLEVGTYQEGRLTFPLEVVWKTASPLVYQGETIALTLMILKQREIELVDSLSVTPPEAGFFEKALGIDTIVPYSFGGVPLYDIPAASYLYTASSSEEVTLAGGRVSLGGISGRSEPLKLKVLPLPPEVEATGAVGQFQMIGEGDLDFLLEGELLRYTLIVSGEGNLNYLQIPDPAVIGGHILSAETWGDYSPSPGGYRGSRYKTFVIQAGESRAMRLLLPPFPYVEKPSGALRIQPESAADYRVQPAAERKIGERPKAEFPSIESRGEPIYLKLDTLGHPLLWLLLLPGPLSLLVVRSRLKRKGPRGAAMMTIILSAPLWAQGGISSPPPPASPEMVTAAKEGGQTDDFRKVLAQAQALLEEGRSETAEELLRNHPPAQKWRGAWHHALGIIEVNAGRWDAAIWHLRTALAAQPMEGQFRERLALTEAEAEILNAYAPPPPLDRRFFFFLLVICVNASALMGIVLLREPRSGWAILLILLLVGALGSAGLMGAAEFHSNRKFGVALADDEGSSPHLKRIPREEAANWFSLKQGTTLLLREKEGEYYLAENGAFVTGWIHQNLLRPVGDGDG